jgi:hypothetical protein
LNALTVAKNDKKKQRKGPLEYDANAFNEYLDWFIINSRISLCPLANVEEILEKPTDFEDILELTFNKAIRDGGQTLFAPTLNFVVFIAFYLAFICSRAYMLLLEIKSYMPSVPSVFPLAGLLMKTAMHSPYL